MCTQQNMRSYLACVRIRSIKVKNYSYIGKCKVLKLSPSIIIVKCIRIRLNFTINFSGLCKNALQKVSYGRIVVCQICYVSL